MAFDGLNLNPYSKVRSTDATEGFTALPGLENMMKARLLANQYSNDQAIEAAKLGYEAKLDAYKPKETSWGDVAMGVAGSAAKAGLFDGDSIFGTPSFGQAKADAAQYDFGSDAGYGGNWSGGGTPSRSDYGSSWWNPMTW